jgi:hypothetical protein
MVEKHSKPWLHLDMDNMSVPYAARMLRSWMIDNGIKEVNVAGPCASSDPEIYRALKKCLKLLFRNKKRAFRILCQLTKS